MKMRLVPKLAMLVLIVVAIVVPVSGTIAYAHSDVPWVEDIGTFSTGRLYSTTPPPLAKPTSPAGTLTIDRVYTTDNQGKEKNSFAPGDEFWPTVALNNSSGKKMPITITARIFDPSGKQILEVPGDVEIPKGASTAHTSAKAEDTGNCIREYTLKLSVVSKANPMNKAEGQSTFTVGPLIVTPPVLTIDRVYTTDNQGKEKNSFAPGDEFWPTVALHLENTCGKKMPITITTRIFDPSGKQVLGVTGDIEIPEGASTLHTSATVEETDIPGEYTLKISVVDKANPNFKAEGQSTFTVTGGTSVRVASSSR